MGDKHPSCETWRHIVARAYSWTADLKIAKTAMRAMRGKKNRERGCIFILLIIFKTKLIKIHTH